MKHQSAAVLALAIAMAGTVHAAEPDFSASRTEYEPVPAIAGDVIHYTVTISNSGGDSTYSRVVTSLPRGYFIGASGDCAKSSLNWEDRRLVWHEGAFTAGSSKRCRIDLLSRRESAGTMAPLLTEITTPPASYFRSEAGPELATAADPSAIRIGTTSISQAGLVSITVLLAAVLGAVVLTRVARGRHAMLRPVLGAWFMVVLALGFLLFFVDLARDDIRSYRVFRETTCFVFDSAIRAFPGTGKSSNASTYEPIVAVRYEASGVETYAAAYPPPSAVSRGWIGLSQRTLERFAIGSVHLCWYDPDDVRTVLVERGPGAAYFFALLPLIVLAYGAQALLIAMRRT